MYIYTYTHTQGYDRATGSVWQGTHATRAEKPEWNGYICGGCPDAVTFSCALFVNVPLCYDSSCMVLAMASETCYEGRAIRFMSVCGRDPRMALFIYIVWANMSAS